jgi:hypothetical protein
MRPPPLALIATGSVNDFWYPGSLPHNPWDEKIQNALFDSVTNRIIIEATDGFWTGPVSLSRPFHRIDFPAPVFVMGATVFEPYGKGGFLVGSFNGLFHWKRSTGNVIDMLTGSKLSEDVSPVMPADSMVTGYFKTPGGDEFITTHEQGLLPLGNAPAARFKMPEQMRSNYRMPLWNFMFEIHNGRIFKDLIGGIYILIAPLGSVLFLLITVSGVYDWLYLKIFRKKKK